MNSLIQSNYHIDSLGSVIFKQEYQTVTEITLFNFGITVFFKSTNKNGGLLYLDYILSSQELIEVD